MLKLVWQVLSLAVAVGMIGVPSPSHAQETPGSPVLVDWTAPASQARLARSAHKVDFFPPATTSSVKTTRSSAVRHPSPSS